MFLLLFTVYAVLPDLCKKKKTVNGYKIFFPAAMSYLLKCPKQASDPTIKLVPASILSGTSKWILMHL